MLGSYGAHEYGGFGGGAAETAIVMATFAKALILEPYIATVILAGGVFRHGAKAAEGGDHPRDRGGPNEAGFRLRRAAIALRPLSHCDQAKKTANRWTPNGGKGLVLHGDSADRIIVSARTSVRPGTRMGSASF